MNTPYSYLHIAGKSDIGLVREHNEDSFGFSNEFAWACVADGMGGEQAGDFASQTTIRLLEEALSSIPDESGKENLDKKQQHIDQSLLKANAQIRRHVREKELNQSGTTVAALAFDISQPDKALVVHAGDSRVYRLRGEALNQITIDHSVAAAAGVDNESDIPLLFRGVVTKAVGIKKVLELDIARIDIEADDLFLLCSDGLCGFVDDKQIADILYKADQNDLDATVDQLIKAANDTGGKDNITAVLVQVTNLPPAPIVVGPLDTVEVPEDEEVAGIRASIEQYLANQAASDEEDDADSYSMGSSMNSSGMTQSTDAIIEDSVDAPTFDFSEPAEPAEPATAAPATPVSDKKDDRPPADSQVNASKTLHQTPTAKPNKWLTKPVIAGLVGLIVLIFLAALILPKLNNQNGAPNPAEKVLLSPPDNPAPSPPTPVTEAPPVPPAPAPVPVIDEAAQRAAQIDKLKQTLDEAAASGAWGAAQQHMADISAALTDLDLDSQQIEHTQKWFTIWNTLQQQPGQATAVYNALHAHTYQLARVGGGETTQDAELAAAPDERANQTCAAIYTFSQQAPKQIEDLSQLLRTCAGMFSIERESVLPYLQTFYQISDPIGDIAAFNTAKVDAQQANKALFDFKRIAGQSPSAFLKPTDTPEFSATNFTREIKSMLAEVDAVTQRPAFEAAVEQFNAQLQGTTFTPEQKAAGGKLLAMVSERFDALSLVRINHPSQGTDNRQWISADEADAHREHFLAVAAFMRWNREVTQ